MAPQHPKNAIRKIIEPIIIVVIGAHCKLWSAKMSESPDMFDRTIDPIVIIAIPPIWKNNGFKGFNKFYFFAL